MTTAIKAHTPGPWHWYGDKGLEAKDETILCGDCATPSCRRARLFVDEANARLIAAAPELANLVLRMFTHVSHGAPTLAEAEVVLKKAGLL